MDQRPIALPFCVVCGVCRRHGPAQCRVPGTTLELFSEVSQNGPSAATLIDQLSHLRSATDPQVARDNLSFVAVSGYCDAPTSGSSRLGHWFALSSTPFRAIRLYAP